MSGRLTLLALFSVLIIADMFGVNLSFGAGLSLKNLVLYILLIVIITRNARLGIKQEAEIRRILITFVILVGYAVASWAFASLGGSIANYDKWVSGYLLKSQLLDHLIFFYVFYSMVTNTEDAMFVIKGVILLVIAGNIITIMDAFNMPDLGIIVQREDGRVSGPLGEANQYAAFLVLFIPAILARLVSSKGVRRLLVSGGLLLSVAVLFLTASRGAVVGIAVGSIISIWYLRRLLSTKKVLQVAIGVSIVFVIGLGIAVTKYGDTLEERFVTRTSAADINTVSSSRYDIWKGAMDKQIEQPASFITGFGWNSFKQIFPLATHNTYLAYLFFIGIPGLLIYLLLVYRILNLVRRGIACSAGDVRNILVGFLFGFSALLVAIFFVNLYAPWLFIWAYVGLVARVSTEQIREARDVISADAAKA